MKLWLIKRSDLDISYDEFCAFVVRAASEDDARAIASAAHADEGAEVWWAMPCIELGADGDAGIVLSSFNAG